MELSTFALMCAVKAIQHDITRHERLASDESLDDDDLEYHGQKVLDLTAVLSEVCRAYELAQANDTEWPTLTALLAREN